jgi:hypothetical protein
MAFSVSRLPSRFPVGTKFIIEGRQAGEGEVQVFKRFLEFPDGRHLRLPAQPLKRKSVADARRNGGTRQPAARQAHRST